MANKMRFRGDRGQMLILAVVTMTGILGITALAIDAAYMYDVRNRLYAAADGAAKSGAIEVRRAGVGIPLSTLNAFANRQMTDHGLPADCGVNSNCVVNHPPVSGPFTGNQAAVEVIVQRETGTFFGKLLGWASGTPGARAVAGIAPGPDCIVTFDHIIFSNPAAGNNLTMPNCGIVIGEIPPGPGWARDLTNNATITAKSIGVVHNGAQGCSGNCGGVTYGVPVPTDPLVKLPAPSAPSPIPNCAVVGQFPISGTVTITDDDINKYYCGWNFNGGTLNLVAASHQGIFYINGPITDGVGGSDVIINCTGCMIFLTASNGRIQLSNSNHVTLAMEAPSSGTYEGILFYQDRGAPADNHLIFGKNNTTLQVRGAFYFPKGTMVMKNENSNLMTNPCTLIVAYGIEVDKPNFTLDNACLTFGGSPILSLSLGE